MQTRTFIPLVIIALTGALALACGSSDRTFIDPDVGTPPLNDGSMSTDVSSDGPATVDQGADGDASVGFDAPPGDVSTEGRADATGDARPDVAVGDTMSPDTRLDGAPPDVVADIGSDITVTDVVEDADATGDTGGAPDINPDILGCTPLITPAPTAGYCPGKPVTLTSSAATSYLWSNGATTQSIDVGVAGSYTVTTTDSSGCTATSAATAVVAHPAPALPTISALGPTRFCQGGSVTLTSSVATGYLWSTGAVTQSIVVNSSGNYSVTTTDVNGCTATSAAVAVTVVVPSTGTRMYAYTGVVESFTVPECITQITVDARGAQGGTNNSWQTVAPGGLGGQISARLNVAQGAVVQIRVGGQGVLCSTGNTGGWNGGGVANCTGYSEQMGIYYSGTGGGATDLRLSPYTLDDRVIVAGGGGGAGFNCRELNDSGGAGGGQIGGKYPIVACSNIEASGGGGTQAAGGAGGFMSGYGTAGAGVFGTGGLGVCTGGTTTPSEGGGGGGGYWGGGGGCWHGGGGGSDYLRAVIGTVISENQGINAGNGSLGLSWGI